jgi:hypothetical protein
LIIFQYSHIADFSTLSESYINKLRLRSGLSDLSPSSTKINEWGAWIQLAQNYLYSFFPFLIIALFTPIFFLWENVNKICDKHKFLLTLYIISLPVVLHHLIFFSGTVIHDFFILKDSVAISIIIAVVYGGYFYIIKKNKSTWLFNFLILIFLMLSIIIYYQYNSDYSPNYKIIGEQIKNEARGDEVVFISFDNQKTKQVDIVPQYIIYAQRNIALFTDKETALKLIELNNSKKGVVFYINNTHSIYKIDHIILPPSPNK